MDEDRESETIGWQNAAQRDIPVFPVPLNIWTVNIRFLKINQFIIDERFL